MIEPNELTFSQLDIKSADTISILNKFLFSYSTIQQNSFLPKPFEKIKYLIKSKNTNTKGN